MKAFKQLALCAAISVAMPLFADDAADKAAPAAEAKAEAKTDSTAAKKGEKKAEAKKPAKKDAKKKTTELKDIKLTPELQILDDVPGTEGAAAKAGDKVYVHYTGMLPDGKVFDTSSGRAPIDFTLGRGQVIEGWDKGIAGMKVKGSRKLVIPPKLAYGDRGVPPAIPATAHLIFDVVLEKIN